MTRDGRPTVTAQLTRPTSHRQDWPCRPHGNWRGSAVRSSTARLHHPTSRTSEASTPGRPPRFRDVPSNVESHTPVQVRRMQPSRVALVVGGGLAAGSTWASAPAWSGLLRPPPLTPTPERPDYSVWVNLRPVPCLRRHDPPADLAAGVPRCRLAASLLGLLPVGRPRRAFPPLDFQTNERYIEM